jgi:hypothetical protein
MSSGPNLLWPGIMKQSRQASSMPRSGRIARLPNAYWLRFVPAQESSWYLISRMNASGERPTHERAKTPHMGGSSPTTVGCVSDSTRLPSHAATTAPAVPIMAEVAWSGCSPTAAAMVWPTGSTKRCAEPTRLRATCYIAMPFPLLYDVKRERETSLTTAGYVWAGRKP